MLPNPEVPGQAYRRPPSRGLIEAAGIAGFGPWDILPAEPWNPPRTHGAHLGTSLLERSGQSPAVVQSREGRAVGVARGRGCFVANGERRAPGEMS